MAKRKVSNLDLKIKLTNEYLDNGGYEKIPFNGLLEDLKLVKKDSDGKVDPNTVSVSVNAFMLAILGSHLNQPPFAPDMIFEYKSTLQKSYNFDQQNIDTEQEFDKIYDEYKVKNDTLFRGQREAKWRLYSKIQRQWILEQLFSSEDNYQTLLESLVELGKAKYGAEIKKNLNEHNIDSENSIAVLGYLQHHGCPTPLLDWTYKFQNALFFGLDGLQIEQRKIEIDDYFSVYHIEENYFEGSNLRVIIENGLREIEKPMLEDLISKIAGNDIKKKDKMTKHFAGRQLLDRKKLFGSGLISHMTTIPNLLNFPLGYFSDKDIELGILFSLNNSLNIQNQQGVFIWNADPAKPIELVGDELYMQNLSPEEAKNYSFCSCFNINKKLAAYVRKRLEEDGINKEFIYPTPEINTYETFEKAKKSKTAHNS